MRSFGTTGERLASAWRGAWKRRAVRDERGGRANMRVQLVRSGVGQGMIFLPGFLLILLGVAAVLMPSLVIALIASLLVFLGALFCFVAWKVMQWKHRFEQISRDLRSFGANQGGIQGTILFGGSSRGAASPSSNEQGEIFDTDDRGEKIKIILH